jgi:hypothetical protein
MVGSKLTRRVFMSKHTLGICSVGSNGNRRKQMPDPDAADMKMHLMCGRLLGPRQMISGKNLCSGYIDFSCT